jgi:hypothetical protein
VQLLGIAQFKHELPSLTPRHLLRALRASALNLRVRTTRDLASTLTSPISHFLPPPSCAILPPMRKRTCLITLGVVAALALTAWLTWPPAEPSYNGHTLSYWLDACTDPTPGLIRDDADPKAIEAITRIGTNALPTLLAHVEYKPDRAKRAMFSALSRAPMRMRLLNLLPKRLLVWMKSDDPFARVRRAAVGFYVLGPRARPAIPVLLAMMKDQKSPDTAQCAQYAFACIGPDALPYLIAVLQDTNAANAPSRYDAAACIGILPCLRTNAAPAVPALIACLKEQDPLLPGLAVDSLRQVSLQHELVVPAIIQVVQTTTNVSLRGHSVWVLGEFGSKARAATNCVFAALSDPDGGVRRAATNALLRIAPELVPSTTPP